MLVRDVMQRAVGTLPPHANIREAMRLVCRRGIRHVAVLDDGRMVGIVSDRDVKELFATGIARDELDDPVVRMRVDQIMTREVVTATPTMSAPEAAALMLERRISALPVLDEGRLVGIVTETDVLVALLDLARAHGIMHIVNR